ncbi:MAG: hypothetical protein MUE50_11055 [Pirellulaceae bacterium]|jgi:hypothetical protein|nr:hypothetical protein [Pirellulaceae bacterium]
MDWKHEIRRAYAVVIWFFQEVAARHRSGIYPEGPLAIKEYRLLTPGSIYPLRLSDGVKDPILTWQQAPLFPPDDLWNLESNRLE